MPSQHQVARIDNASESLTPSSVLATTPPVLPVGCLLARPLVHRHCNRTVNVTFLLKYDCDSFVWKKQNKYTRDTEGEVCHYQRSGSDSSNSEECTSESSEEEEELASSLPIPEMVETCGSAAAFVVRGSVQGEGTWDRESSCS